MEEIKMMKQKTQVKQLAVKQAHGARGTEIAARMVTRITMGLVMVMAAVTPCFADITNVGQNAGGWLQEQIFYVALAIIAVVMLGFLMKKAWIPAGIFIVIGAIILAIIGTPETLRAFGQSLLTRFTQ
jgi:uncharacterized membrane protein